MKNKLLFLPLALLSITSIAKAEIVVSCTDLVGFKSGSGYYLSGTFAAEETQPFLANIQHYSAISPHSSKSQEDILENLMVTPTFDSTGRLTALTGENFAIHYSSPYMSSDPQRGYFTGDGVTSDGKKFEITNNSYFMCYTYDPANIQN